ncbi:MAG: hypothetical protein UV71_C0001G0111 [Microgenomates group bacterium GW2011_GWC1_43_13]|uniref:Uncharacterized protein n=2 Tax=Candidatus Woeseibacteriota TaxID=1752722 RepID=A0A837IC33_9BACT|nr:MAG: hypothetical protein UV71_C0001G0111 [Microgenomates group bacterium GW2011_GWC1_43_13]KKT32856.1 MAG: hypothetical protein UW20_C0008G0030 [Candidatus Woesebacteria bacterium GW2011_GWB1_44_11]KKT54653.1 MAG: hypothetical protein UW47_C0004G0060 [Candidatus Woesebacteria bacterium GW2011_GWA1_44_23]OGM75971.1 MAG: hypothetical protein A2208_00285 [Candidatus Woesebacteria bacterium RIFOXYA1_FULL_43_16]OGM81416.1 MAG: hypothetical protein A2394_03400 [Candidatus Woesebacteria bacterium 
MENILTTGFDIWILIKALALIILGMYLVFAFVITRQVKLMTSTLRLGFDGPAKILSYLHLVFAVLVFLAALVIL